MTIVMQQTKDGATATSGAYQISFNTTPQAGCMITVCVGSYTRDLTTTCVTDNQGNTYTRDYKVNNCFSDSVDIAIYSSNNVNSSGTFTITVNPAESDGVMETVITEWRGCATSSAFDQSTSNTDTGTAASSGNITPTEDNEVLIGVLTFAEAATRSITEDTSEGWALLGEEENNSTYQALGAEYIIQTTAAQQDADWTLGTTSGAYYAFVVSYKAAATGGTTLEVNNMVGVGDLIIT